MTSLSASQVRRDTSVAPVRVAIFTTHPIQYQAPLFRELAARPEIALTVFYGSRHGLDVSHDQGFGSAFRWDIPLLDGYEYRFLTNVARSPDVARFTGLRLRDIKSELARGNFDVCLTLGWGTMAHLQFMRAARALGIPLWIRGESNLQRRPFSGLRGFVRDALWIPMRRLIYSSMFRTAEGFLVIGSRNRAFYRAFGVPERKLHLALYGVENDRFALPPAERAAARQRRRAASSIADGAVAFVSSGKLLSRKRPFDVLEAFAATCRMTDGAHLVFLGDGPERAALESEISRLHLTDRVTITGFINQNLIPEWYAASDCLILASNDLETWGLVVNEAMAAGLPVIVSDAVGCAPDLVDEGKNGYVYPFGDTGALADRMRAIIKAGAADRTRMGVRSLEIVKTASFSVLADKFVDRLQRKVS